MVRGRKVQAGSSTATLVPPGEDGNHGIEHGMESAIMLTPQINSTFMFCKTNQVLNGNGVKIKEDLSGHNKLTTA
eukprot:53985-Ditylum_brightwellii.AAC.1